MTKQNLQVASSFESKLLKQFKRVSRHLLVGEISIESGYFLNTVEQQLQSLEERGAIRRLTHCELKKLGLHDKVDAYALVDPGKFTLVEWSDYC